METTNHHFHGMYLVIVVILLLVIVVISSSATAESSCSKAYTVKPGDTLNGVAVSCGVALADLRQANPQITAPYLISPNQVIIIPTVGIPVTGGQVTASSPTGGGPAVTAQFQVFAPPPTGSYIVQSGDTLLGIAVMFNTTVDELMKNNPAITKANLIIPGQQVIIQSVGIPVTGRQDPVTQASGGPSATTQFKAAGQVSNGFYRIVGGDTLRGIAAHFNTTVDALIRANSNLTSESLLSVGQQLYIPGSSVVINGQKIYILKSSDYLSLIAANQNVTLTALEQANPGITDPSLVFPGDRLIIP